MMTNQTAGEQVPIISATAGFSEASILLQTESKPSKELDTKRIGFLVREEERSDIEAFLENHPQCSEEYIPVAIIGEGTFSTVYKAIDVQHYRRNNSRWIPSSRQDQWDCARLLALMTAIESTVGARARARNSILRSRLYTSIRKFMIDEYSAEGKYDIETIKEEIYKRPPVFVAIKRINATSGPKRIAEEIAFLRDLQGIHSVIPVVDAKRWEDQVIVVSPYFASVDFRDLLSSLRLADIAGYMRLLLEALAHVHSRGIMHRDVKPSNFLFSREKDGTFRGLLVDFGLAQVVEPENSLPKKSRHQKTGASFSEDMLCGTKLANIIKEMKLPPGRIENDPRVPMKASRAGTRGFRAPEVLFKVARQTVAIDVWSAGVIMLTLLTRRYPFFHSTDDCDALAELACIFGSEEMQRAAESYGRVWASGGMTSISEGRLSWRHLCRQLNPSWPEQIPQEAFDLLDRLLDLNYKTRITALNALQHSFLVNY